MDQMLRAACPYWVCPSIAISEIGEQETDRQRGERESRREDQTKTLIISNLEQNTQSNLS